jgi:hypothetical protein
MSRHKDQLGPNDEKVQAFQGGIAIASILASSCIYSLSGLCVDFLKNLKNKAMGDIIAKIDHSCESL